MSSSARIRTLCSLAVAGALIVVASWTADASRRLSSAGQEAAGTLSTLAEAKTPQLNRSAPDSERPVGEWNTCDVVCRKTTIEVTVNGVPQNRVSGLSVTEGNVGFQLEGTPFELRNVSIVPLT